MDPISCPRCGAEMVERERGPARLSQCPAGHGVFLDRADLGGLVEAESDFHERAVHDTAQFPRITGTMPEPPAGPRGFVETLFD